MAAQLRTIRVGWHDQFAACKQFWHDVFVQMGLAVLVSSSRYGTGMATLTLPALHRTNMHVLPTLYLADAALVELMIHPCPTHTPPVSTNWLEEGCLQQS